MYKIRDLNQRSEEEVRSIAEKLTIPDSDKLEKKPLIYKILDQQALAASQKGNPSQEAPQQDAKAEKDGNSKSSKGRGRGKSKETESSRSSGKQEKLFEGKSVSATDKKEEPRRDKASRGNKESKNDKEEKEQRNEKGDSEQGDKEERNHRGERKNGQQRRRNNGKQEPRQQKSQYSSLALQGFSENLDGEGVFDLMPDGYGFLRSSDYNYLSSPDDVYVSHNMVRTWGLKKGDLVEGKLRPPKPGEKFFGLNDISSVNNRTLQELRERSDFRHLTPLFPEEKFKLSYKPSQYALRMIELFAPIGKGQRAMIVSPPKAGKTMLLKEIANGISHNHPEAYLIILMIGERPEEVTDMRRSVKAEVLASTFDEPHENHVKIANITIEKAKRMVECGHDVVLMLDSITRLARAYNNALPSSGKLLSGGVDAQALHIPKRFFGAARNIENGGSLTNIATALVDTGSKMDEVIFEEFKGTGNTELMLSRTLANKNFYPALDIVRSSTRRGENLQPPEQMKFINMLRRVIGDMHNVEEPIKFLLDNMKGTKSNEEFLASIHY